MAERQYHVIEICQVHLPFVDIAKENLDRVGEFSRRKGLLRVSVQNYYLV